MLPLSTDQQRDVEWCLSGIATSRYLDSREHDKQMRALKKLQNILRHGSRRRKEIAKINMQNLSAPIALSMCRRGLHVGYLTELRIQRHIRLGEGLAERENRLYNNHKVAERYNHARSQA